MASSKVMASASAGASRDRPRQTSSAAVHSFAADGLQSDQPARSGFGSMNMDEILKNIYSDSDSFAAAAGEVDNGDGVGGSAVDGGVAASGKTVDEVWKEIVSGGTGGATGGGSDEPEMTLEDFLTKHGAVREEDVRVPMVLPTATAAVGGGGYGTDPIMNQTSCQFPVHMQNGPGGFGVESHLAGFGNGMVAVAGAVGAGGGSGRGKRRASVEELPLDKATQQKQRRMIKNRESAARSRERKQAYTVELESLVLQLEAENARLLREEAEQNKQRLKQLMENLIPVTEKRRPARVLRRVQSMSW